MMWYVYKCVLGVIIKRYIVIKVMMIVGYCIKVYVV